MQLRTSARSSEAVSASMGGVLLVALTCVDDVRVECRHGRVEPERQPPRRPAAALQPATRGGRRGGKVRGVPGCAGCAGCARWA
eukprot:scaffold70081_cov63-Phaeocystis_antarctica.AAC.1